MRRKFDRRQNRDNIGCFWVYIKTGTSDLFFWSGKLIQCLWGEMRNFNIHDEIDHRREWSS